MASVKRNPTRRDRPSFWVEIYWFTIICLGGTILAVVVLAPGAERPVGVAADWLEGRAPVGETPTAFICHGTRCSLPITDPALVGPLSPAP